MGLAFVVSASLDYRGGSLHNPPNRGYFWFLPRFLWWSRLCADIAVSCFVVMLIGWGLEMCRFWNVDVGGKVLVV
jgi:hypothetical protein